MMSEKSRTIDAWLENHATHQPEKTALRFEGASWTYRDLQDWVAALASHLSREYGLARGDRIAFLGANSAAEVALFFAAARLGLMIVPLNWRLAPDELGYIVSNAGARLLVHSASFADLADDVARGTKARTANADLDFADLPKGEAVPQGALKDPFLIVYTSGTTGRPKGAVLTQEAVFWNALISLHAHDFTPDDHILNVLPLFHVGGINIQMMPCFYVGGTVTLHVRFDPSAIITALSEGGITTAVFVPTMMRALMGTDTWQTAKFPNLRMLNTGSTDVPVDILEAVNARGIPMVQVYGATETGPIATYQRAEEAGRTIGSIGRPGAHMEVKVMSPDGIECAPDVPGEIWVKGPNNFSYYWQNPQATAASLQDGWFKTGDVARRDVHGLLWFVSRLKHVIISGGENIYPAEIERLLMQLPGLREVAVVGRPDPRWGEVPVIVAAIEEDGPSEEVILATCDTRIAKFKRPKDVALVQALPRNAMGKVLVDEVRKIAAAQGLNLTRSQSQGVTA
ncbi:MAG: AMP-binding protein [Pseudomonadota bacterium]